MIALSLAELAEAMNADLRRAEGVDATLPGAVRVDSRRVAAGDLFFALRGDTDDGHSFAAAAVEAGAWALVVERELPVAVPQLVVADGYRALAALARSVVARVRASGDLRVVGITGSNGKTTTKNMVGAILQKFGPTVAPPGSYNNHVGAPLSMLDIDLDTRYLIVELGASAPGAIAALASIAVPDVAAVLKVGLAHVGGFGGIEVTQATKAELVTALPDTAVAILNSDDARVASMAGLTGARVVRFGLGDAAEIRARDIDASLQGTSFTVVVDGQSLPVDVRILGEHHVMNALAAIAIVRELGVQPSAAIAEIEAMSRAERWRMEVLEREDGVTVINDAYNASPDSMAAALKTLAQVTRGSRRSIAVLGEMSELGESADTEHDRVGRLAVRLNIDLLVVVGHRARHIHNAAGLEGSWDGESVLVDSQEAAYDLLRDELRPGDVVLVKSSNSAQLRFLGDRIAGVS